MKYTRIILVGYKRMLLNGIDYFEMNIQSPLQLILGTNGCGKSSLLWELSPLPANASDFLPDGSKTIELEHKGQHYILASIFAGKQEHSFICNGQELNKGRTITVQKDLVKEHFKLTTDIQELVTGRIRFDSMPAIKRKEWLLRLCDVNYDYALSVYAKLKASLRDRTGAIRLEKKALVVESEKLLQEQEIERIQTETKSLHECLSRLLEHRKPVESDLTTISIENERLDKLLMSLANSFIEINQKISEREHSDIELMELIDSINTSNIENQTRITVLAELFDKTSQKISVLQSAGLKTISDLQEELLVMKGQADEESTQSFLNLAIENPHIAYASFASIKGTVSDIFSDIPNNSDKKYSQSALLTTREKLAKCLLLKNSLIEQIADRKASMGHMRDHVNKPDTTCPKCKHSFSLVYSEARMLAVSEAVKALEDKLKTVVYPQIAEYEEYIEKCNSYGQLFRQYQQIQNSTQALKPYWDYLADKRILTEKSEQGVSELAKIERDLLHQIQMENKLRQIKEIEENLALLQSVGNINLSDLQTQNASIEAELSTHTQALQIGQVSITRLKNDLAMRREAMNVRKSIRKAINTKRQYMNEQIEHERRTILNQLIRDLQSALATREHALFAAKRQKEIVQSIVDKIESFVQEEQALTVLVKELSPTEGLIAEGMLGFIKNFCDQMNSLIQKIWSYPLVIKSCEVVDGDNIDLDYLFPLVVGEAGNQVSDVSKGSTGMQEIINVVFRLTAMRYLGLQDSALYLDELGSTFDKDHRTAAASMVRSLIEEQAFPQVFMISHYQGMYGALSNAQICVLNGTNILVPKEYNTHVVMH